MTFHEIISGKIVSREELRRCISRWRFHGRKIVFTNGCFDLLHPGHVHLINSAKSFGDLLVVGVNADSSVKKLKPGRPLISEKDRAITIASLEAVDAVIIFGEETPLELIKIILPDVLVKGADYKLDDVVGKEIVEALGGQVELVTLLAGFSSSSLIEKIKSVH